jgi:HemY protein
MIWLILRVLLFACLLAALAAGGAYLADSSGQVAISWRGVDYPPLTHLEFIAVVGGVIVTALVLLKLLGLLIAVMRFLLGDETALTRQLARSKEKRGLEALTKGMIAMAEGEIDTAENHARRAGKLLGPHDMVGLLSAQIAEARGDSSTARERYRELAREPATAMVGVKGLLGQAVQRGELSKALKLAEHAFEIRPKDHSVQQTLFELQVRNRDWGGAHKSLEAMVKSKTLPQDVALRRAAILDFEDARTKAAAGNEQEALALAEDAIAEVPTLVPAAAFAARLMMKAGQGRKAARVLRDAWEETPHPSLAEAYAALEPEETASARRRRFRDLIEANADHPESRLLEAELALSDEDLPAARKAIGTLPEETPTHRSLALMGAIEKAAGAPEAVVRGYLAKAVSAPRGAHWQCEKCGTAPGGWSAACPNCGAFDTLSWRESPPIASGDDPALLPLLLDPAPSADDVLDGDAAAEAVEEARV